MPDAFIGGDIEGDWVCVGCCYLPDGVVRVTFHAPDDITNEDYVDLPLHGIRLDEIQKSLGKQLVTFGDLYAEGIVALAMSQADRDHVELYLSIPPEARLAYRRLALDQITDVYGD